MSAGYETFCRDLLDALGLVHPVCPPPGARLVDDLGFDSFRHLEVVVHIERGHQDLPPEPPMLRTLGDAHEYHRALHRAAAAQADD